jgi:pimeloyl-ACP methyl ester carboxylesterase
MLMRLINVVLIIFTCELYATELPRRASWQAQFKSFEQQSPGMVIKSIEDNAALAKVGIQANDRIIKVNNKPIWSIQDWHDITDALTSDVPHQIEIQRDFKIKTFQVVFAPMPSEEHPNIETIYGQVTSDFGLTQRIIITKPKTQLKRLPAMIILQGLSCSSIEVRKNRMTPFTRLLNELVEHSNRVVLRVEKPGMGDSSGNCSETDFLTELNGYETALKYFLTLPYVDDEQVVVYGNSMGSALAPYFANKFQLAGVISDGTYVKTWFEHMLEIERRILNFKGFDESTVNNKMNEAYIPLYYGMLIQKKSYQDVINDYPALARDNYHDNEHMYGRPMTFYHQLQNFDVSGQWQQLKVPARIRWGTNDWIMSEYDNDMIVQILEAANHSDFELYKHPGLDHWQTIHTTALNSFKGEKGHWDEAISQVILDWLKKM